MDKLAREDMQSLTPAERLVEVLKREAPECFVEGRVDTAAVADLLGDRVGSDSGRFGLEWSGKSAARRRAHASSTGTLRPCPDESLNWETTKNLFVEGDNLEVLKLLQRSYHRSAKLIYIDPPYNTGNEFVYNDKYGDGIRTYLEYSGQLDSDGRQLRANPETSGRYHRNWLDMMYPRLLLARNLLRDDGLLFVSIDDHELANLRLLLDEVMGEENFVSAICVQVNKGGRDYLPIAVTHEYLLCYRRSDDASIHELPKASELPFEDSRGGYELRELRNRNPKFNRQNRPNLFYPFYVDASSANDRGECTVSLSRTELLSVEAYPRNSQGVDGCWRWGRPKAQAALGATPEDSDVVARQRRDGGWNIYEKNRRVTAKAKSIWDESAVRTEQGTIDLRAVGLHHAFDHPKPVALLKKVLQLASSDDDLVVDFFAGSGTLGEAVTQLNAEDGRARRYLLVQLPEQAKGASYDTICEVAKARLRAVNVLPRTGAEVEHRRAQAGAGFRVFRLDTSNVKAWDPDSEGLDATLLDAVDNIRADRSEADVVFEILLKYGLDLATTVETRTILGKAIYVVGRGALVICLAPELSLDVVERIGSLREELPPAVMRVVFRDASFADDVVKVNAMQILTAAGIDDVRTV